MLSGFALYIHSYVPKAHDASLESLIILSGTLWRRMLDFGEQNAHASTYNQPVTAPVTVPLCLSPVEQT